MSPSVGLRPKYLEMQLEIAGVKSITKGPAIEFLRAF
jgi:hypothetical protein